MCPYSKSLYQCNHFRVASESLRACPAQKEFLAGRIRDHCDVVETHPRNTIRVPQLCEACAAKKTTADQRFAQVKARMAALRTHLDESYANCMRHLDEAGLGPEDKPGAPEMVGGCGATTTMAEDRGPECEVDPVQAFLRKKMAESDAHLMMFHSGV
ncbi:hypothetical protein F4778DRAFT_361653 [Xylariomycetidae sp. FL2044]|nr:hypothetical protein F4778DRAFT_361653 [Xylariomycetidae sp. FL2044]